MIRSAYEFNNVIFTAARLPQIIQNFQVPAVAETHAAQAAGAPQRLAWRRQRARGS